MKEGEGRFGPKRLNLVSTGDAGSYESDSVHLDVLVDGSGNLVMEGEDVGPKVRRFLGKDEYEFWVTVPKRYKDGVLLHLIKEVFSEGAISSDFMEWLDEKKIPYEFNSY